MVIILKTDVLDDVLEDEADFTCNECWNCELIIAGLVGFVFKFFKIFGFCDKIHGVDVVCAEFVNDEDHWDVISLKGQLDVFRLFGVNEIELQRVSKLFMKQLEPTNYISAMFCVVSLE